MDIWIYCMHYASTGHSKIDFTWAEHIIGFYAWIIITNSNPVALVNLEIWRMRFFNSAFWCAYAHQAKSVCNCVEHHLFPYDSHICQNHTGKSLLFFAIKREHKTNKFQLILVLINHTDEQHLLHKLLHWESIDLVFNFKCLLFSTCFVWYFKLKMLRMVGAKQHEIQNVQKNRTAPQFWPFEHFNCKTVQMWII